VEQTPDYKWKTSLKKMDFRKNSSLEAWGKDKEI
jgi:hypothetical protein